MILGVLSYQNVMFRPRKVVNFFEFVYLPVKSAQNFFRDVSTLLRYIKGDPNVNTRGRKLWEPYGTYIEKYLRKTKSCTENPGALLYYIIIIIVCAKLTWQVWQVNYPLSHRVSFSPHTPHTPQKNIHQVGQFRGSQRKHQILSQGSKFF